MMANLFLHSQCSYICCLIGSGNLMRCQKIALWQMQWKWEMTKSNCPAHSSGAEPATDYRRIDVITYEQITANKMKLMPLVEIAIDLDGMGPNLLVLSAMKCATLEYMYRSHGRNVYVSCIYNNRMTFTASETYRHRLQRVCVFSHSSCVLSPLCNTIFTSSLQYIDWLHATGGRYLRNFAPA